MQMEGRGRRSVFDCFGFFPFEIIQLHLNSENKDSVKEPDILFSEWGGGLCGWMV